MHHKVVKTKKNNCSLDGKNKIKKVYRKKFSVRKTVKKKKQMSWHKIYELWKTILVGHIIKYIKCFIALICVSYLITLFVRWVLSYINIYTFFLLST